MTQLVQYERARAALAEATRVDQVLHLRDEMEHVKLYAKQIKDRALMADAAEFQLRIERRLGALLVAAKAAGQIAEGRRPKARPLVEALRPEGNSSEPEQFPRVTLEEVGVDRKLSMKAQQAAAMEEADFEALVLAQRARVVAGRPINLNPVDEERQRQNRRDLARGLSEASASLSPEGRKFPCVYADPAVRWKAGEGDRSYENHYPTMTWDEILAMPVADRLLPDAWLFLWLPRAHLLALHEVVMDVELLDGSTAPARIKLPLAWAIARAWGCDSYSTSFVWTKTDDDHPDETGMGLVVRDQDEILCLFKRGRGLPKPRAAEKFGSNHRERSKPLGHSRKPEHYRQMIASMTDGLPVLELFARVDAEHPLPPGWEAWGNQAAETSAAAAPKPFAADAPGDEMLFWKALGAVESGVGISGPAVRGLIGDGFVQVLDNEALELTDAGRWWLAELDRQFNPSPADGASDDPEVIQREALVEIRDGRHGAMSPPYIDQLREMKFVAGKNKPKLTKKGEERLQELLERHERLARLAALPCDIPALVRLYGEALEQLDAAVVNNAVAEAEALLERLELLQERANGDTHFGMACDDSPAEQLRAETAAPIGVIPTWGQRGVFRLVVDDVPHLVTHDEDMDFAVYAEDPDEPFLSETGYRSFVRGGWEGAAFGCSVREQAEAYIREAMTSVTGSDGKPRPRKGPVDKPQSWYRLPSTGLEPVVVGGDLFAEEAVPEDAPVEFEDDGLEIPAFLRRRPAEGAPA